jgi:acyl-CoA synthetase (AMP-forming)/AMP-acid ligase II
MIRTAAIMPSYDYGASNQPLLGETIGENFNRIATTHADREALVDRFTGRRWTYARLHHDVLALAHGLIRLGIDKGDRVGIWAPNCPEWTVLQYATAEIGAILVPINPAYRTDELAYVVNQAGIRLLVAARSFRTSDYATMIKEARPGCPDLRWVVLLGSADWLALPDSGGDPRALAAAIAARQALLSPDDPINIQYTSGTTGHPKGATLSHHNILNNAHLTGEILGYTEHDRICVPVPLYHTFGMVIGNLGATTHGACLVYPAPAFDPAATLAAVEEERCTSLYGVPAMFIAELAQPGFDAYDLSSQPGKTTEAIDAARWMHTGDLATMDADGYVAITGRLTDMVIRGGENVSPREIEEFLHTHQDVQDVQVIGVPDARLGEEIMAWIRLRPGAPAMTAADVREFADGKLAHYKIPRYVRIVEDFPMTASGKVRKVEMREAAVSMLGLTDIAASQYAGRA